MECYKHGSCGVYESYSCSECPASEPTYRCKNCLSYSQCKNIINKGVFVVENCSSFPYLREKLLKEKEAIEALKEKKLREAEAEAIRNKVASGDYISRSAVLEKSYCTCPATMNNPYGGPFVVAVEDIENEPAVGIEIVKHGRWIEGVPFTCSECGKPAPEEKNTPDSYSCWMSPYCPHCGCKMDNV